MKKSILLFSAILMTLTALGFINWNTKNLSQNSIECSETDDKKPTPPLPFYVPKPTNLFYDLSTHVESNKAANLKPATYNLGREALLDYLKEANKKNTYNVDYKKLSLAKLVFTVNKTGSIKNLKLDKGCGYENIDNAIIELLKNAPGQWTPAVTDEGETISQELVISFGSGGC